MVRNPDPTPVVENLLGLSPQNDILLYATRTGSRHDNYISSERDFLLFLLLLYIFFNGPRFPTYRFWFDSIHTHTHTHYRLYTFDKQSSLYASDSPGSGLFALPYVERYAPNPVYGIQKSLDYTTTTVACTLLTSRFRGRSIFG